MDNRRDTVDPDTSSEVTNDAGMPASELDFWARQHPWHPRIAPWFVYMLVLAIALHARDWQSWTYVPIKVIQTGAVLYLVWRWRSLVPEIRLHFHWSVIPVSLALVAGWIGLHDQTIRLFPTLEDGQPTFFQTLHGENQTLFWLAAVAHLAAMCTAVPIVEETFNRSVLLRSFNDSERTQTGLLQWLCDMPLIGDWMVRTEAGSQARRQKPAFTDQFETTPLGQLSVLGVTASTLLFMLVHATSDWPGAILCGITWCVLLSRTAHLGLGPVIWSHALVNVLLWIYVVTREAWPFL